MFSQPICLQTSSFMFTDCSSQNELRVTTLFLASPWRGNHALAIVFLVEALSQARKRHININFLVRLLLGHPGNVPGTNRVCPWDKVGLSQGQTQVFFLFYTAEAQFVPGTNPVCPWDIPGTKGGRQSLCVKSLCAFFVPYWGLEMPLKTVFSRPQNWSQLKPLLLKHDHRRQGIGVASFHCLGCLRLGIRIIHILMSFVVAIVSACRGGSWLGARADVPLEILLDLVN